MSIQNWPRIFVIGLSAVLLVGCDSNSFPKSWAEFKAFNPFDPKSGAEIAVRRHFETHSKRQDGNMQFIHSVHSPFGEQADVWEIRKLIITTSLSKISEADRLNGIEGFSTFDAACSAYRKRSLFPKESKEWSLWQDGGEILKGEAVKRKEGWSVQLAQSGSNRVSIANPEQYKIPEAGKRLAQAENQEKKFASAPTNVLVAQPVAPEEAEVINQDKLPKKLAAMVAPYAEARFFDSHTHVFEGNYEAVWQAVERTLKSRGDKVIARDQTAGTMMTDVTRHGILGSPVHDKFFIYLESQDSSHTRIEFVLFSLGMGNQLRIVPITDKEFVVNRAQKFLALVEAALKPKR